MSFKPLGDRYLVRQEAALTQTKGGIIIPEAGQERPMIGTVLAVGEGQQKEYGLVPLLVGVGERVYFSKFGGVKVKLDDFHPEGKFEELIILREGELLGSLGKKV